ncbi:20432_t:CDS:10, partial [Funneliformis geosporum]
MAISQDSKVPPPLPPRRNIGTGENIEFAKHGKTPPAWLCTLIRHSPGDNEHLHEFYLSEAFDSENETVLLCQKCHSWFHLTTTASNISGDNMNLEQGRCVSNRDNNLHHLHTTTMTKTCISTNCCLCKFSANVEIKDPLIDMEIFNHLSKLRKHSSYANIVRNNSESEFNASLNDVIDYMIKIVDDLLSHDMRSLTIHCEEFQGKIGLDEASKAIFQSLGFQFENNCLSPIDSLTEQNNKLAKEELKMISFELNSKNNAKKPYEKLGNILGTKYNISFSGSCTKFDPSIATRPSSSFFLGCVSDMDDQTLIWAYKLGIFEFPEKSSEYLQAIYEMSKERKSEALEELVVLERSLGKFSVDELKESYKCLNVENVSVSDELVIDAYNTLVTDQPSSRANYRNALTIIAKARKSEKLINFINDGQINEVLMLDYFSEMPVGLDNIGNTCYLNSLLQYYFTIRPLRQAVLKDSSSIDGHELDWQSITIGHRKVSRAEVERANKFVALLRGLFVNLIHTQQKSLSPDIDLAYLALVNAKSDEEENKDSSKSPIDLSNTSLYDDKMAIDDPSPGPSYKDTDHVMTSETNDHNYISEEETVVIMEGTAASTDNKNGDAMSPMFQQNDETNTPYSSKGKEKESNQTDLSSDLFNNTKEEKLRTASEMLFGKQHDVTECMDNVMFQLEAALKSSFMIDENGEIVAEGRDLYEGLDVYFDTSMVEYDGTQAIREVTITKVPPILQIHVQRVQFDRSTSNIYKSNAYLRFDKVIYLDRYLEKNYDLLKQKRNEAHIWRQDIDKMQEELKDYEHDKKTALSTVDLLKSTAEFIHVMKNQYANTMFDENFNWQLSALEQESNFVNNAIGEIHSKTTVLKSKLKEHYQDLRECEYRLHAVFIHSGQATFGHYWIYIYDFEKDRWLKFNDSYVTELEEREVFADTTGSSANPYCMVYVRAQEAKELVET